MKLKTSTPAKKRGHVIRNWAFVLLTTSSTTVVLAPSATSAADDVVPTTVARPAPLVSHADMVAWGRVAWCETHANWQYEGPRYDGGLGISRVNWVYYGGHEFAPAPHLATPEEQVVVAQRIQAANGHAGLVPDQNGECSAW